MSKYHSIALRTIGVLLILFGIWAFIGALISDTFTSGSLISIATGPLLVVVIMIIIGLSLCLLKKWGLYLLGLCFIFFIATLVRKGLPEPKEWLVYTVPILFIYLFSQRKLLN